MTATDGAAPRRRTARPGGGGARVRLNRERVVVAAMALADAGGVEALTMRALAARLGVEAMSLYNHLRNKDDLLDALVDALAARITRPEPTGDWRAQMKARALSMRAVFQAHAWAPPVFIGRIALGPHVLGLVDATIGCLKAAGFSYPDADHVWHAIDSHTYGFHVIERHFPVAPSAYQETASAYLPTLSADSYPHLHALGALVASGAYDGVNAFEFGLDALLETFERRRQAALGAADSVSKA